MNVGRARLTNCLCQCVLKLGRADFVRFFSPLDVTCCFGSSERFAGKSFYTLFVWYLGYGRSNFCAVKTPTVSTLVKLVRRQSRRESYRSSFCSLISCRSLNRNGGTNRKKTLTCAAGWLIVTRCILTFLKRELGSGVIAALFSFVTGVCWVLSDCYCVNMVLNIIPLFTHLHAHNHAAVVFFVFFLKKV